MVTLESSKLFSHLPPADVQSLSKVARQVHFAPGQQIFKEGDPGDGVYVVRTGLVQISATLEKGERHVFSHVVPGDVFGEMSVLDNQSRSACASAEEETSVYFVPREELVKLLQHSPELSLTLMQEISGRLREFNHQYIRKLLQAERMAVIGRFASSIVHDLKNPLTIIGLASELLCEHKTTEAAHNTARERIARQIERINSLVDDILEFTRGGAPKLQLAKVNYAAFVGPLMEEFKSEALLKSVTLEYENSPPEVRVALNPRRLSRVFYNLFGNAIDAMPAGGKIKLRFELHDREVTTEIEDTGTGIAPEVVDHLFDAFVTFGKARGTGLGLSITRKIIEDHGGKISARNQPGGGAIFSFTLPR